IPPPGSLAGAGILAATATSTATANRIGLLFTALDRWAQGDVHRFTRRASFAASRRNRERSIWRSSLGRSPADRKNARRAEQICESAIPAATDTLKLCVKPAIGIRNVPVHAPRVSSDGPSCSLPNSSATGLSVGIAV